MKLVVIAGDNVDGELLVSLLSSTGEFAVKAA